MNYYNEFDPHTAAWLRALIERKLIAPGVVDERSISDVNPDDLVGFRQCHFFAGIGGWSYALRLAGWSDNEPVWTGSCPCQPFSTAGKQRGTDDERHLWPEFARLIAARQPSIVFGEQVASGSGRNWLSAVRLDLEKMGYAVGAADLCAASVGAPHIRQRLFWGGVAHSVSDGSQRRLRGRQDSGWQAVYQSLGSGSADCGADANHGGWTAVDSIGCNEGSPNNDALENERVADSDDFGCCSTRLHERRYRAQGKESSQRNADRALRDDDARCLSPMRPSAYNQAWRDADWLFGRDGQWRPVESGLVPLGHGLPARVVRLRGYGNAIVPQVAQAFIEAFLDAVGEIGGLPNTPD